jgi:hypothetical protein
MLSYDAFYASLIITVDVIVGCISCIVNDHGRCYLLGAFYASLMLLGAHPTVMLS